MPKLTIAQIRANKVLDVEMNYDGVGVMTRRQFVERAHRAGKKAEYLCVQGSRKPDLSGYYESWSWWIGSTQATKTEVDYLTALQQGDAPNV